MAPQFPSIQSFFHSSPSPCSSPNAKKQKSSSSATGPGDGFTAEEVNAVLNPVVDNTWTPTQDYAETEISDLEAGPKCVTFMGRIVNFYDMVTPSKRPRAAKGCIKLVVADDSGALTVRLWYANLEYKFRIGHLVTIWTPHISHGDSGSLASPSAPYFTSIFPERDRSCHIMIHENSDEGILCKKPSEYKKNRPLPGLMTVKNFIDGGYDVADGKILVCIKSIGARKKFTNKKGNQAELINIGIFDDTAEATLTLWGATTASAASWVPSQTILLIRNPNWRIDRKAWLSITANTRVDVNPDIPDAQWLRSFAQRWTKREHVNPLFPEEVFDVEAAETAQVQCLYTLAEIDEFQRHNPGQQCIGYISVLIMELNILLLHRRNMLMCTECCGVPLYANSTTAKCKQCEKAVELRINPRILGTLLDETAQISPGKLILSTQAWEQLLGRTAENLMNLSLDDLKYLEYRMLFLRLTMGFVWGLDAAHDATHLDSNKSRAKSDLEGKVDSGDLGDMNNEERDGKGKGADGGGDVGRLCIWCVKM